MVGTGHGAGDALAPEAAAGSGLASKKSTRACCCRSSSCDPEGHLAAGRVQTDIEGLARQIPVGVKLGAAVKEDDAAEDTTFGPVADHVGHALGVYLPVSIEGVVENDGQRRDWFPVVVGERGLRRGPVGYFLDVALRLVHAEAELVHKDGKLMERHGHHLDEAGAEHFGPGGCSLECVDYPGAKCQHGGIPLGADLARLVVGQGLGAELLRDGGHVVGEDVSDMHRIHRGGKMVVKSTVGGKTLVESIVWGVLGGKRTCLVKLGLEVERQKVERERKPEPNEP